MNLGLKNKRIFVTGASRGIGLGIAKAFIEVGARVVINARETRQLQIASDQLGSCDFSVGDMTDAKVAASVVEKAAEMLGGLDVVVCNVGSGSSVAPGLESYDEWQRIFGLNFFSSTNVVEAARLSLKDSGGAIVCISSICGVERITGAPVTYSVAKAALNAYVKAISAPLASDGIRINTVAPGNVLFNGSVWAEKLKRDRRGVMKMLNTEVPLARFGTPDDISNLVLWLASDLASNVTGAVFVSDGGQTSV